MTESKKEEKEGLPRFDRDLSREHPKNREAARARGWRFNSSIGYYEDSDGCLVADQFGQSLG
ncbi:MAG: hypothetical protein Q7R86_00790 [bacterium]|nr:hypothetical protein [bacterium]